MANQYSGTDNLEVMAEAVNYNKFLNSLILGQARKGMYIVDYGAGIGTFAKVCSDRGLKVVCVEPDIQQARAIAKNGIEVYGSMDDIKNDSVDLMYTLNVLEHIQNDGTALGDMYAKLKNGGRLLIYVPAFEILYSSMDRKVGHYRRYTRADLYLKVKQAGFEVIENKYVDSLGFAATLLYKMIGSDDGSINLKSLLIYDRIIFPISRVLDKVLSSVVGKNVYMIAEKPCRS
jgi:SAM-dependent methyltransferase